MTGFGEAVDRLQRGSHRFDLLVSYDGKQRDKRKARAGELLLELIHQALPLERRPCFVPAEPAKLGGCGGTPPSAKPDIRRAFAPPNLCVRSRNDQWKPNIPTTAPDACSAHY